MNETQRENLRIIADFAVIVTLLFFILFFAMERGIENKRELNEHKSNIDSALIEFISIKDIANKTQSWNYKTFPSAVRINSLNLKKLNSDESLMRTDLKFYLLDIQEQINQINWIMEQMSLIYLDTIDKNKAEEIKRDWYYSIKTSSESLLVEINQVQVELRIYRVCLEENTLDFCSDNSKLQIDRMLEILNGK